MFRQGSQHAHVLLSSLSSSLSAPSFIHSFIRRVTIECHQPVNRPPKAQIGCATNSWFLIQRDAAKFYVRGRFQLLQLFEINGVRTLDSWADFVCFEWIWQTSFVVVPASSCVSLEFLVRTFPWRSICHHQIRFVLKHKRVENKGVVNSGQISVGLPEKVTSPWTIWRHTEGEEI